MSPVGFEPATPASERPQTYALDGAATGTGINCKGGTRICCHSEQKIKDETW
jgi:hypothetical protein